MTHKKKTSKKKYSRKKPKALIDLTNVQIHNFTYEQVVEANKLYQNSRYLWQIADIIAALSKGQILTVHELEALKELNTLYNTLYNSSLAKALKEEDN